MKKIGIVGFGRFGELLAELSNDTFDVHIVEVNETRAALARSKGYQLIPFQSLKALDIIFLAVPISRLEEIIQRLTPLVDKQHIILDLCSVKVFPAKLMQKHLTHSQLLATHPLFGPDSAKKGLAGLKVAFCPLNIKPENLKLLKNFWTKQGVEVIQTTPEAHDKDTVYSQAFTYSLARIINNMHLRSDIAFTTRSFEMLRDVAIYSANDSEQLFHDMLCYNPYFKDMRREFEAATQQTLTTLQAIAGGQPDEASDPT